MFNRWICPSSTFHLSISILVVLSVVLLKNAQEVTSKPAKDDLGWRPKAWSDQFDDNNEWNGTSCGYSSCPKIHPDKINVHVIAHTHDDVGWLKTVDQYYYGTRKRYSPVGVQHILDSVIPQLVMDKSKRFIYVEMSFFVKWWLEQDDRTKEIVRDLVNEGRLEFINGGWCMNDEATVNYQSTIEQMTLGLKFLNQTFGNCGHPKVGWQIDPFGHTNEQASLFAQFGFDGMFFTRISYLDKSERIRNKSLDLIWHGDRALNGQTGSIFTNIFRDGYDSPSTFCFDVYCYDDELVDNKKSYEYNINTKGQEFIEIIREHSKSKLTNQILIPFGGDFHFSAAGQNFKNIDKLIKYIKQNAPDINMFYSTPSCYQYRVYQVSNEKSLRLPEKYNDFMPYDSSRTIWWSGYFTSRPSVKLIERELADLLQVSRLVSFARLLDDRSRLVDNQSSWTDEVVKDESSCLEELWQVLGDLQHHDAITGTEKQHVANDYVRRSSDAAKACSKFIGNLRRDKLGEHLIKSTKYDQLLDNASKFERFNLDAVYLEDTMFCPLLNISQCDALESNIDTERYLSRIRNNRNLNNQTGASKTPTANDLQTKSVLLTVYNPLAKAIYQHDIRLPCNGRCDLDKVKVVHIATNETMKLIRLPTPSGITKLPFRDSLTNYEILFYTNLPPLGYTSFIIEDNNNEENIDEETDYSDSIIITDEQREQQQREQEQKPQGVRNRRIREKNEEEEINSKRYEYLEMNSEDSSGRLRRDSSSSSLQQNSGDKVIVKFDMHTGMIVGLKRVSDGSMLHISQKFGYYYPALYGHNNGPGAYIFRPNTSEPYLFDKPSVFKMFKRKNGALIEIHQKWASWLWQTIRVDAKKNYIEFDYVVGPIPITQPRNLGREVVSRYITNMQNKGVFMTDSNARQLLARHRLRDEEPEQLGGSFYPVVSTMMLRNNIAHKSNSSTNHSTGIKHCDKCPAEAVAILVDRSQAGTSLHEGQMELLVHRRHTRDDQFGVDEALDEPGEDGRGLVTRGKHRLYLKFFDSSSSSKQSTLDVQLQHQQQSRRLNPINTKSLKNQIFKLPETPRANLDFERGFYNMNTTYNKTILREDPPTYIVNDQVINDLKQESVKFALQPVLTFDRLRVSADDFMDMLTGGNYLPINRVKTDLSVLNTTLPANVHLLTLQPWSSGENELLIRLENLDNPLTVHPYPDYQAYQSLVDSYKSSLGHNGEHASSEIEYNFNGCTDKFKLSVDVDLKYLLKRVEIVSLDELNLGANSKLKDDSRLDWTNEEKCDSYLSGTVIKLHPRQIRTFLAHFELL